MEKVEVDIHLLVARAIKRPHCRRSPTAIGYGSIGEGHQPRPNILLSQLTSENFLPHIVRAIKNTQGKDLQLLVFIHPRWIHYFGRFTRSKTTEHLHCLEWILTQQQGNQCNNHRAGSTNRRGFLSSTPPSTILVVGFTIVPIDPFHKLGFYYLFRYSARLSHSSAIAASYPIFFACEKSSRAADLSNWASRIRPRSM